MVFDMNKLVLRKLKELESTETWKEEEIEDIIIESVDLNKIKHTIINSIMHDCYGLIERGKIVEVNVDIVNIKNILSKYTEVVSNSIPDNLVFNLFNKENVKKALGKYEINVYNVNVFEDSIPWDLDMYKINKSIDKVNYYTTKAKIIITIDISYIVKEYFKIENDVKDK